MVKSIEETYIKMKPEDHILEISDTYVGSKELTEVETYLMEDDRMKKKKIFYTPALYKIFDEVLVNAADQHVRSKTNNLENPVNIIKVNIDKENNEIKIYNNGEGIDIILHSEHNIYIVELLFGNLLTSANYDKSEDKITGGKNGYGAKLANIFSTLFKVVTVDSKRKLKYVQTWENNMSIKSKPKITKYNSKPYTEITFKPDLKRFNLMELSDENIQIMKKRVYDMTACTDSTLMVYFNDEKINCKMFEKYIEYYIGDKNETPKVYEQVSDRWAVGVCLSNDDKFEQISFVNSLCTFKGGKHVDYVSNQIAKKLQIFAEKKGVNRKKYKLKTNIIKDNMMIFIRSTISNPSFDSQTKEYCTTVSSKFGSNFEISDKFIEKMSKLGIIEKAAKFEEYKNNNTIAKTDGKKKNVIKIPKLDDANWAGTNKSQQCTLILTEGDSAKSFAVSGLAKVGRNQFGVFPLRGKMLNVRDCNNKKVAENAEINNIKKILGLQQFKTGTKLKKVYEDTKELRYGRVMILTDQDVDGSHIKGLFINYIHNYWPSLLKIPGFIISLATPIVKAKKGKKEEIFYTLTDYNNWKENNNGWETKYYKGLGTSTSTEAKVYFDDFENKKIEYLWKINNDEECVVNELKMNLAFSKKEADLRKVWLKNYNKQVILEQSEKKVLYSDFFDKDFIHFSNYDNERSIPCICDGLKPSQRKVLYGVFKKNLKKGVKVAQLTGYISENAAYHHGETSLNETIISMAQDYVGSNNINLLNPDGQFGTRIMGGKDAGAPRYIWTYMNKITSIIFNPNDNNILNYKNDDGQIIEPEWYIPIIPMILVNGTEGIGTGFSTKIPPFNPIDIINNIYKLMDDKNLEMMKPWYRGFNGDIDFKDINEYGANKYMTKGIYKKIGTDKIKITELPIGKWIDDFKEDLDNLIYDKSVDEKKKVKQCIVSYKTECTESKIDFEIKFKKYERDEIMNNTEKFEQLFKMTDSRNTSMTNMHLYNSEGTIKKYHTVLDILKDYYIIRLEYYKKRKDYILNKLKLDLDINKSKSRFIKEFMSEEIKILNVEEEDILENLEKREYLKFKNDKDEFSYDYLINMTIRSLTKKKIEELKKIIDKKEAEYNELESKDEKTIWKEDLKEFEKEYKKFMKEYNERYEI
jgi:DNA topoisomerase-2